MTLQEYLSQLDSAKSEWGIWVDPKNPDNYRIGQFLHENGGLLDGWVGIGSLESLSYGNYCESEVLDYILSTHKGSEKSEYTEFIFDGKVIKCHRESMKKAYFEDLLALQLAEYLRKEIEIISQVWAVEEASVFVSDLLPEILEAKMKEYV